MAFPVQHSEQTLSLFQSSSFFAGGFLDYRPGIRNIVDDVSTSAVLVEFANHANIKNLKVGCVRAGRMHGHQLCMHLLRVQRSQGQRAGGSCSDVRLSSGRCSKGCTHVRVPAHCQSTHPAEPLRSALPQKFWAPCRWSGASLHGQSGARRWRSRLTQCTRCLSRWDALDGRSLHSECPHLASCRAAQMGWATESHVCYN